MAPFFKPRQLPRTSYGYQPPPGAVARGWRCVTWDCGAMGDEVPRRWPFPCSQCGGPTDPALLEPWQHEARGVEIPHLLAQGVDDGGFTEMEWPLWQFKEALRVGDAAAARSARADVRALDEAERNRYGGWISGRGYFTLVFLALQAGDLDSAADDLVHWLGVSSAEDVEHHNGNRTNCRQAIDSALSFLAVPGAESHPQAGAIRSAALALAEGAYPVLGADAQQAIVRMARV